MKAEVKTKKSFDAVAFMRKRSNEIENKDQGKIEPTVPVLKSSFTPDLIEAGCDEVGRGCLAGPVVAAAVILPKNFTHELLNDSKQLTKEERNSLQDEIKQVALAWAVA